MNKRKYFWLSLCLLLAACASQPKQMPASDRDVHSQHLASISSIQTFILKGRIGIIADGKGFSGSITWQHQLDADTIEIFSPLGSKIASIDKNANTVTLTTQDNKTIHAEDIESLTEKALGWRLPLNGLSDWALGRPTQAPIQSIEWDEHGYVTQLAQQDWTIQYLSYHEPPQTLPTKITLNNAQLRLKLVIEEWQTSSDNDKI